jgi:hypothetical protein
MGMSSVKSTPISTAIPPPVVPLSNPQEPASLAALTCGSTLLYTGQEKGAGWVERTLGWTAEIVRHPQKPTPEGVMMRWARG